MSIASHNSDIEVPTSITMRNGVVGAARVFGVCSYVDPEPARKLFPLTPGFRLALTGLTARVIVGLSVSLGKVDHFSLHIIGPDRLNHTLQTGGTGTMKTGNRRSHTLSGITLAVALSLEPAATLWADLVKADASPSPSRAAVLSAGGRLPLSFEVNQGQTEPQVQFLTRWLGHQLFLTPSEAVLMLRTAEVKGERRVGEASQGTLFDSPPPTSTSVVRMRFEGANANTEIVGLDKLPGLVNYFIGSDSSKWRANVPTYQKVAYRNIYAGIDLVYYGHEGQLEYDLIVAPGADPTQIKLTFQGVETLMVAESGDLVLPTPGGDLLLLKNPLVYQIDANGQKRPVVGRYVVTEPSHPERREVSIRLAAYDHATPLIIDPVLVYSTYLGGSGLDTGADIAVDSSGNAYIVGSTNSSDFPTLNAFQPTFAGGAYDVFLTKLGPSGVRLYSTYLGGSGDDTGTGIAVDTAGNVYLIGSTTSSNFPVVNASQPSNGGGGGSDAFITKIGSTGIVFSTYLGGRFGDYGNDIAVDNAGFSYVTGQTTGGSPGFPTTPDASQPAYGGGSFDAFFAKFSSTGVRVYSTYLGGSYYDYGYGIAVDGTGNAFVVGATGTPFPVTANASQPTPGGGAEGFLTKFDTAGLRVYSSYLGGFLEDVAARIAVDSAGQAVVTGYTESGNFPTLNASQSTKGGGRWDGFVTRFDTVGARIYSTFLGGSADDFAFGVALDGIGAAYVVGYTSSTNFPVLNPSQPTFAGGTWDGFVTKFDLIGARLYSTYLGGSGDDLAMGAGVDGGGAVHVAGQTTSANFPTLNASQSAFAGGSADAFVINLADELVANAGPDQTVNEGAPVTLDGSDSTKGVVAYIWTQVSGPTVILNGANTVQTTFTAPEVGPGGVTLVFQLVVGNGVVTSNPDTVTATVLDLNDPPVCALAQASPASLWSPNLSMVPVSIVGVSDPNNQQVTITITRVTQDEPVSGPGAAHTSPDATASGHQVLLRAEREGKGDGRVYEVYFTASDGVGGACTGRVQIQVPLAKGRTAIDSGQLFDSTLP